MAVNGGAEALLGRGNVFTAVARERSPEVDAAIRNAIAALRPLVEETHPASTTVVQMPVVAQERQLADSLHEPKNAEAALLRAAQDAARTTADYLKELK